MRGFTLYETLVTMVLAGLVLGISGQILLDYSRISKQARMHADGRELAAHGLAILASQLRSATGWSSPGVGATASEVDWTYWTMAPDQWLTPAADGSWSPSGPGRAGRARVWMQGQSLVASGWTQATLADGLASFEAHRLSADLLELKAVVNDSQHSQTVVTLAMRMTP